MFSSNQSTLCYPMGYPLVGVFKIELRTWLTFLSVDIPLGGYWKWWECTELEGLVPGYQYVLLSDRLHNLARIINLNFDFILIKSKLYIRPLGSL